MCVCLLWGDLPGGGLWGDQAQVSGRGALLAILSDWPIDMGQSVMTDEVGRQAETNPWHHFGK